MDRQEGFEIFKMAAESSKDDFPKHNDHSFVARLQSEAGTQNGDQYESIQESELKVLADDFRFISSLVGHVVAENDQQLDGEENVADRVESSQTKEDDTEVGSDNQATILETVESGKADTDHRNQEEQTIGQIDEEIIFDARNSDLVETTTPEAIDIKNDETTEKDNATEEAENEDETETIKITDMRSITSLSAHIVTGSGDRVDYPQSLVSHTVQPLSVINASSLAHQVVTFVNTKEGGEEGEGCVSSEIGIPVEQLNTEESVEQNVEIGSDKRSAVQLIETADQLADERKTAIAAQSSDQKDSDKMLAENPIETTEPKLDIKSAENTQEHSLVETPIVQDTTVESPIEDETVETPLEDEAAEKPTEQDSFETQIENETVETPIGKETVETPIEIEAVETTIVKEIVEKTIEHETFDTPIVNETVETPIEKETVETPSEHKTVETLIEQELVETPIEQETVETPIGNETVQTPIEKEAVVTPSEHRTVETQLEKESVETPIENEEVKKPTKQDSVETPTKQESAEKPIDNETVESIVIQESVETPIEQETVESIVIQESVESPIDNETVESIVIQESVESPIDNETVETIIIQESVESPIDNETVETIIIQESVETPIEHESVEKPINHETVETPTEPSIERKLSASSYGSDFDESQAIVASCTLVNNQPIVIMAAKTAEEKNEEIINLEDDITEIKDGISKMEDEEKTEDFVEQMESRLVIAVACRNNITNIRSSGSSTSISVIGMEEEEEKGVEEVKWKGLVDGVKEQDRISIHSHTELVSLDHAESKFVTSVDIKHDVVTPPSPSKQTENAQVLQQKSAKTKQPEDRFVESSGIKSEAATSPPEMVSSVTKPEIKQEKTTKPETKKNIISMIFGCFGCKTKQKV